jgi:hypothetical protein
LVEQRKYGVLFKKPCHFSEKKSQKSGRSSGFLKPILEQKKIVQSLKKLPLNATVSITQ